MTPATVAAPRSTPTYTIETATPRASAMGYARRLVRQHGVRLRAVNFRRGPDGAYFVSAPAHPTLRFCQPG